MEHASNNEDYEVEIDGDFEAISNGEPWAGRFEVGIVSAKSNGRFLCHYARVTGPDGREWIGKSRWSLKTAARSQLQQMVDDGVQLLGHDLDENWQFESQVQGPDAGYLRRI